MFLNREEAETATELAMDMPGGPSSTGLSGTSGLNVQGHRGIRTFDDA